jgi:site-specific DNA recombinase
VRDPGQKVTKPKPDPSLIKAVVKRYASREQLEDGSFSSVRELARDAGFTHRCVGRLLRLAWLAPDIIEAILDGTQPEELSLENFRQPISADWNKQRKLFGIV